MLNNQTVREKFAPKYRTNMDPQLEGDVQQAQPKFIIIKIA